MFKKQYEKVDKTLYVKEGDTFVPVTYNLHKEVDGVPPTCADCNTQFDPTKWVYYGEDPSSTPSRGRLEDIPVQRWW